MITVKEDTTLVGISELRTNIDKILEEAKKHKVLIERRNKPVAVLLAIERYADIEKILGTLEDVTLGYLAKERKLFGRYSSGKGNLSIKRKQYLKEIIDGKHRHS